MKLLLVYTVVLVWLDYSVAEAPLQSQAEASLQSAFSAPLSLPLAADEPLVLTAKAPLLSQAEASLTSASNVTLLLPKSAPPPPLTSVIPEAVKRIKSDLPPSASALDSASVKPPSPSSKKLLSTPTKKPTALPSNKVASVIPEGLDRTKLDIPASVSAMESPKTVASKTPANVKPPSPKKPLLPLSDNPTPLPSKKSASVKPNSPTSKMPLLTPTTLPSKVPANVTTLERVKPPSPTSKEPTPTKKPMPLSSKKPPSADPKIIINKLPPITIVLPMPIKRLPTTKKPEKDKLLAIGLTLERLIKQEQTRNAYYNDLMGKKINLFKKSRKELSITFRKRYLIEDEIRKVNRELLETQSELDNRRSKLAECVANATPKLSRRRIRELINAEALRLLENEKLPELSHKHRDSYLDLLKKFRNQINEEIRTHTNNNYFGNYQGITRSPRNPDDLDYSVGDMSE